MTTIASSSLLLSVINTTLKAEKLDSINVKIEVLFGFKFYKKIMIMNIRDQKRKRKELIISNKKTNLKHNEREQYDSHALTFFTSTLI